MVIELKVLLSVQKNKFLQEFIYHQKNKNQLTKKYKIYTCKSQNFR